MDIQMPKLDGLAATRLIKAELPDVKIVMLTMSDEDGDIFEAIMSGASGYLVKTQEVDEFFSMFIGLSRGETPLSPGLAGRILEAFARQATTCPTTGPQKMKDDVLSSRQIQVLTLAAQGLTYKEIGAKLYLTERTIKYHMGEIVARLHVENRSQAISCARARKLVK
jgi:two-component system NarL family response regulator